MEACVGFADLARIEPFFCPAASTPQSAKPAEGESLCSEQKAALTSSPGPVALTLEVERKKESAANRRCTGVHFGRGTATTPSFQE